jgi:hypothetical protein
MKFSKTSLVASLALGLLLTRSGSLLSQQTTLQIAVLNPAGATAGAKVGNQVPFDIEIPAGAMVPLDLDLVLVSRLEPCVTTPAACTGGENFMMEDPETGEVTFGCSDMVDNDTDGNSDSMEPECIGVQGFSVSIQTDPCINLSRATTRGTVSDLNTRPPGLRDPEGAFEKTETVSPNLNGGRNGAVSAVVFSFTKPIFLGQVSENAVVKLVGNIDASGLGEGESTDPCNVILIRPDQPEQALRGSGEPVQTAVTVGGNTDNPITCGATLTVRTPGGGPVESQTDLKLQLLTPATTPGAKVDGFVPYDVLFDPPAATVPVAIDVALNSHLDPCVDMPALCDGGEDFSMEDPETGEVTFGCSDMMDNDADGRTDAEDFECIGVQGFSMSVQTDPCLATLRATTRGTVSDLNTRPPGLRDPEGAFEKTETVNPNLNGGRNGAVSAVVFSFTKPIFLQQTSENVVMKMTAEIDATGIGPGQMTAPCNAFIIRPDQPEQALRGSGEPVQTAVTVGGNTDNPNLCNIRIRLIGRQGTVEPRFWRGNPNDDLKVNIADPIWLINDLFRSGPETDCADAGDANDDGMMDLSDAMYLIAYQFTNGPAPRPPFAQGGPTQACGTDPTADQLPCNASAISSCPQ